MAHDSDEGRRSTEQLRLARPAATDVHLDAARARAERALFRTADPARVGRFVLLDTIAAGGMGVVYRAYDPQLDRRVALKLIHPRAVDDRQARDRLIAEARALARLKHPNVVPVHDVLVIDEQVVVVMELVEGETVAAWLAARPRGWREIVAVHVAAGRGLAAAHGLGLVHRDFKPSNAIVGDDGRVRVLDFGLARRLGGDEPAVPGESDGRGARGEQEDGGRSARRDGALTATGDVLGTPAYMAPEQLAAQPATAASDQFSLCVSLYEALYGERPFAGADGATLAAAIATGPPAARPAATRAVPGWLRALVVRGLAAAPAARHPSLDALLAELDREHGWRRWRVPLLVTGLVAAAGAAWIVALRPTDPLAVCDGAGEELDEVWGLGAAVTVRAALTAASPADATAEIDRAVAGLDSHGDAWLAARRASCRATRRRTLTEEAAGRRQTCLDRARRDLAAAAAVLARPDPATALHAVEVVGRMRPVDRCTDDAALADGGDPPSGADAERAAAIQEQLARAEAEEHAGRTTQALALASAALASATELGHPATLIEAGLTVGRIRLFRRELAEAIPVLTATEELALAHDARAPAVIAFARRMFAQGGEPGARERLLAQLELVEPLASIEGDRFARPLLLNNAASLHARFGDRAGARRYLERAHALYAVIPDPDVELAIIDANLALVTEDEPTRIALARQAWRRRLDALGPRNLETLAAVRIMASVRVDPAAALPLADELCAAYAAYHPELTWLRVDAEYHRAFLTAELGDPRAAATRYAEVAALAAGSDERDERAIAAIAAGQVALAAADLEAALAHFDDALVALPEAVDPTERALVADARLGAAQAAAQLGRTAAARALLEDAAAAFAELAAGRENQHNPQRLALARLTLARVLRATGDELGARPLEAQAAAFYRRAPVTYAARLAAIER